MTYRRLILRRALIVAISVVSAGAICPRALGLSTGWPAGPAPTPLSTPPAGPGQSPSPSATPTPTATPVATPIPPSYVQVITLESPSLQYRDQSHLVGAASPFGPYTCVVAMYLNSNDPTQFEIVRSFQARFPGNVYGPSQLVSSPSVSAQYTSPGQLATILTTLTVYPHPENPYGRETLSVYLLNSSGNTLLDAVPIMVYPISTAKIFNAFVINPVPSPTPVGVSPLNPAPSPYPALSPYPIPFPSPVPSPTPSNLVNFGGDTVRLDVQIYNAYPAGTTWVVVYPGVASATPPSSAAEVVNSRLTAPPTDLVPERDVFIEVGTAKNSAGVLLFPTSTTPTLYTVQVVQYRPPYGTSGKEVLATATFSVVSSSFNVNSQLGRLTP